MPADWMAEAERLIAGRIEGAQRRPARNWRAGGDAPDGIFVAIRYPEAWAFSYLAEDLTALDLAMRRAAYATEHGLSATEVIVDTAAQMIRIPRANGLRLVAAE